MYSLSSGRGYVSTPNQGRPGSRESGCPTPLLHLPATASASSGCECPMCYHSVKNPCANCGCPARETATEATGPQQRPVTTAAGTDGGHRSSAAFISPSSDYYSLSPDSPPPNTLEPPPTSTSSASSSQPPVSSQSSSSLASPAASEAASSKHPVNNGGPHSTTTTTRPHSANSIEIQNLYSSSSGRRKSSEKPKPPVRKPSMPTATPSESKSSRRHSWAGDRNNSNKPTSLQDFKKLLAQQPLANNIHRMTAREMLEASSSQRQPPGGGGVLPPGVVVVGNGSLRQKRSWKDPRFSVIEEEEAGRSRENLVE